VIKAWVNDLNTTAFRIVVSVLIAAVGVLVVLFGITVKAWDPSAGQIKVLIGLAGTVLTMMGFDVLQFVGKRFSDSGYAAAKNPTQPVVTDTAPVFPPADAKDGDKP
jgi:hypothetical protein